MEIPDRLAENIELWKHVLPTDLDLDTSRFFTHWNYSVILMGKNFYPEGHVFPTAAGQEEEDWVHYIRRHRAEKQKFLTQLPSHYDLVKSIRGETRKAPSWAIKGAGTIPVPGEVPGAGEAAPTLPAATPDEGALL